MTIDDYLPCSLENGQPLYSSEMWVSLLEKAYAKMHGGYFNLDKINKSPFEALSDFTGLPVTLYELKPNFFK